MQDRATVWLDVYLPSRQLRTVVVAFTEPCHEGRARWRLLPLRTTSTHAGPGPRLRVGVARSGLHGRHGTNTW